MGSTYLGPPHNSQLDIKSGSLDMSVLEIISALTLGLAALVLTLIAAMIILMMYRGTLDSRAFNFLYKTGPDGKTGDHSVSRLQMLIWNFVVAFALL